MSNLLASLQSSAGAMEILQRGLTIAQNNVANVNTPGYARQILGLAALPFDPAKGIVGGVTTTDIQSARNPFAEKAVRNEAQELGKSGERVNWLTSVQGAFSIKGDSGISGALTKLYSSFSAWSVTPNDNASRQNVLDAAQSTALQFRQADSALATVSGDADTQIQGLVNQVNTLAGRIRDYNLMSAGGASRDAGLDASIYSTLEELSQVANIQALHQPNGSITLLLGGQTALVVGASQYKVGLNVAVPTGAATVNPSGPPAASITDEAGRDITGQITGGQLGGVLDVRNRLLPSLRGDAYQTGDLNEMAKAFADRVNDILTASNIDDGPPAVPGVPLFSYDTDPLNKTAAASTLQLAIFDPRQLAAITSGTSNGAPLSLAALATPQAAEDQIGGLSFTAFYGGMAARIGAELSTATSSNSLHQDMLAQAQTVRQQFSGVSLDAEAIQVLAFQRSYQAAAKMVSVLNELTQTLINLIN